MSKMAFLFLNVYDKIVGVHMSKCKIFRLNEVGGS